MSIVKETAKDIIYNAIDLLTAGKGINRLVGGYEVRFPVRYSRYYPKDYEPYLFNFLNKNCRQGDTFLDCGAHIGLFSVVGSKIVGDKGRVISFEPMPSTRKILEKTVLINNCSNITIRPEAISDKPGEADFFDTGNLASNANSLIKQDRHHGNIKVPITTLDKVREEMNLKVDCIKIDVEGAEYNLLLGAEKTIKEDRPKIFLSLHPAAIAQSGKSLSMIWDLLNTYSLSIKQHGSDIDKEFFISQEDLFDVECYAR